MPRQPSSRAGADLEGQAGAGGAISLDTVDRQLLALLSEDGRRSYAELAQAVGLSPPSVYARVKKLEERRVIQRYTILIDPGQLGFGLAAWVGVRQQPGFHWERLEASFRELSGVEACYSVTGDESYVLLVRVSDARSLEDLLREINTVEGVAGTRTLVILSTTFEHRRVS
jgi:Lrp/AsnC family transcriptional regulator, leucine-responsive regulatory protein